MQILFHAVSFVSLLSCVTTPQSGSNLETLTPEKVAAIRSVSATAVSPDGRFAAYTISVPRKPMEDEDGNNWSELHVYEFAAGATRPFVTGKCNVASVSWTPDGKSIAFLEKRGEDKFTSLYSIPVDGGESRRLLAMGSNIGTYSFSPDGQRVAVTATEPENEARKKRQDKGFKQEVYEEDFKPNKVWIASLGGSEKPKALALEGSASRVLWSPAGAQLAVLLSPTPLVDDEMMQSRVHVVDMNGATIAKVENPGKIGPLSWSPDGKRIALVSAEDIHDPSAGRLMVADAATGLLRDILPRFEGHVQQAEWVDADRVFFLAGQCVWSVVGEIRVSDGKLAKQTIFGAEGPVFTDLGISRDGKIAALVGNTPKHPGELFVFSPQGKDAQAMRVTKSNPWLESVSFAKQEVLTFKARDGVEIQGILIHPLTDTGNPAPLILNVHGGPEAHQSNGWLTGYANPGQMAAAKGFAVFHCNYRGSTGRGVAFSKLGQGDAAGKEFDDLVDAVDYLVQSGIADPKKVGVTGGSYGGYATAWLCTKYTEKFAAGVMFVGISNKLSKVGTTDIPNEEFYVHARKRPWEDWKFLLERSPIFYAQQCKTPLLIMHGKDDPRVHPAQSRELHRHLKMHGKAPVRLVFYPGEGHGNRKAASKFDFNLRQLQWLEHYLVGPGGTMPTYEVEYAAPASVPAAQ